MWVLMLDTYVGILGTFPKGHKLDLAPDILNHLSKDCYKKCKPPWEEHTDKRAIRSARLKTDARQAVARVKQLRAEADSLKEKAEQLNIEAEQKEAATKKAEGKVAKKRSHLEALRSFALAKAAKVDIELNQLDIEDAEIKAKRLTEITVKAEANSQ